MSLSSWLRVLMPRRRAQHPAAAEVAQAPIDNSVRMHIAASDPDFPARREAAVNAIIAAMDTVAAAHGFTKKAKSWAKDGPLGTVTLHLQRSRYGFDCLINLGFQPVSGAATGPWAQDDFVPLGRFLPDDAASDAEGTLIYLDIHDDPSTLAATMHALDHHALPWLLAHLTNPQAAFMPTAPAP